METALENIPGVKGADAAYRTGKAIATYDPERTAPASIVEACNSQGFYRASVDSASDSKRSQQLARKDHDAPGYMAGGPSCRMPMFGLLRR